MATSANQIVSRTPRIVRGAVAAAGGVVPVGLAYTDANKQSVLASSFEVQNLGPDPLKVSFDAAGTNYRTVVANGIYMVEAAVGTLYVSTTGNATYEITLCYDRFR